MPEALLSFSHIDREDSIVKGYLVQALPIVVASATDDKKLVTFVDMRRVHLNCWKLHLASDSERNMAKPQSLQVQLIAVAPRLIFIGSPE
jgi:hypothetical protein